MILKFRRPERLHPRGTARDCPSFVASRSALAAAAVFSRQAEWPTQGFEKAIPLYFRVHANLPVFFRRGKQKTQEIGWGRQPTAAHAQAKKGALEQTWRRVTGGGQPLAHLMREPCSRHIRPHDGMNILRKLRLEQVR